MLCGCRKIIVKLAVKVITIEPSADALSVEWVVELFAVAFEQVLVVEEAFASLVGLGDISSAR